MSLATSVDGRPGVRSPSRGLLPLGPAGLVVVLEAAWGPVGPGAAARIRAVGARVPAGTDGGSGSRVPVAVP